MDLDTSRLIGFRHSLHSQALNAHIPSRLCKRKASDSSYAEGNRRLAKRMSRLNLENAGQKMLHVTVESPSTSSPSSSSNQLTFRVPHSPTTARHINDDSLMQLDDTKHKVYIYNIDDELSDSDADDSKPVFLQDIDKYLKLNRIPSSYLASGPKPNDHVGKELVLYGAPNSLSVPVEKDSVRRAIIESRTRLREQQCLGLAGQSTLADVRTPAPMEVSPVTPPAPAPSQPLQDYRTPAGSSAGSSFQVGRSLGSVDPWISSQPEMQEDPDVMDLS